VNSIAQPDSNLIVQLAVEAGMGGVMSLMNLNATETARRIGSLPKLIGNYIWNDPVRRNCVVYWLLLWFTISQVVTNSQGFNYDPPALITIPIQISIIVFISKLLPHKVAGPLQVLQIFTAIFLSIPSTVLAFTNSTNIESRYRYFGLVCVLLNQIFVSFFNGKENFSSIESRKATLSISIITYSLIFITFLCFVLAFSSGVLKIEFVSFGELYSKRSELVESLENSDLVYLRYVLGWAGGIFIPIIFYFGIKLRNRLVITLSIFLFLGGYLITSQKWIIASCFLILILHLISRFDVQDEILSSRVLIGFNSLVVALISVQSIFPKLPLVDLGVRRSLLDPSIMFQYYMKFVGNYPPQLWSDSNVSRFFLNNDPTPVSRIIGDRFFNSPPLYIFPRTTSSNATAGSIADSLAQGGIIGFFLISLSIIGVFYILHVLSIGRDLSIVFVLSALVVEMLVEGTLHTLLLSRGLIFVFILFFFLPKRQVGNLQNK
jgi:hypothetical protein